MRFTNTSFGVVFMGLASAANAAASKNELIGDDAARATLIRREVSAYASGQDPQMPNHQPAHADEHARTYAQQEQHERREKLERQARWAERLERHAGNASQQAHAGGQAQGAWNGAAWTGDVDTVNGEHCMDYVNPGSVDGLKYGGDAFYNCYSYAVGDASSKSKNGKPCTTWPGRASGNPYDGKGGVAELLASVQSDCKNAVGAVVWREGDQVLADLGQGPLIAAFANPGGFHFAKLPRKGDGWHWKNGNMAGVQSTVQINNQCRKVADLDIFKIDANKADNIKVWNYATMTLKFILRLTAKCTTSC